MKKSLLLSLLILTSCGGPTEEIKAPTSSTWTTENIAFIEPAEVIDLSCDESAWYSSVWSPWFSIDNNDFYYVGTKTNEISLIKNNNVIFSWSGESLRYYLYWENKYLIFDDEKNFYKDWILERTFTSIDEYPEIIWNNFVFLATEGDEKNFYTKDDRIDAKTNWFPWVRAMSWDGKKFAFVAPSNEWEMVYFSGKEYWPYYEVSEIVVSPNWENLAYTAVPSNELEDQSVFIDGEKVSWWYQSSYSPWFLDNNKPYYIASNSNMDMKIIVDDKEYATDVSTDILLHPSTNTIVYWDSSGSLHIWDTKIGKWSDIIFSQDGTHYAYLSWSQEEISIIKDGEMIAKHSIDTDLPIWLYPIDSWCWLKFIGNSLYYLEKRNDTTVLIKDGTVVDLWDVILPGVDNEECSWLDNSYNFWKYTYSKWDYIIQISEAWDIVYLQKPDDKWSIFINKRKINHEFDAASVIFWKGWSYAISASDGWDKMIIREWGKCIIAHQKNNKKHVPIAQWEQDWSYDVDDYTSPAHNEIFQSNISSDDHLFYLYKDLDEKLTWFNYWYGYLGNEYSLSWEFFDTYRIVDLQTPWIIDFVDQRYDPMSFATNGYIFEILRHDNWTESVLRDGKSITKKYKSIIGQKYTNTGDVLFIWGNIIDYNWDFKEFLSLYKNESKLVDDAVMVSDFTINNSWDVIAYIGHTLKNENETSYNNEDRFHLWCTINHDSLRTRSILWTYPVAMDQYMSLWEKKISDYSGYGIVWTYQNQPIWVWCDQKNGKAKIFQWESLLSEKFTTIDYPKIIGHYLIFETEANKDTIPFNSFEKRGDLKTLIIYDISKWKSYEYSVSTEWWRFIHHDSQVWTRTIVFKEKNETDFTSRIVSITPENLIEKIEKNR